MQENLTDSAYVSGLKHIIVVGFTFLSFIGTGLYHVAEKTVTSIKDIVVTHNITVDTFTDPQQLKQKVKDITPNTFKDRINRDSEQFLNDVTGGVKQIKNGIKNVENGKGGESEPSTNSSNNGVATTSQIKKSAPVTQNTKPINKKVVASTPQPKAAPIAAAAPISPTNTTINTTSASPALTSSVPVDPLAESQNAVVNIICTSVNNNLIKVTTGTGVIVKQQGLILTNSHVAQDFLFKDISKPPYIDCTIQQGRLIKSLYKADVLYMSYNWAQDNRGIFYNDAPKGTGAHDYALLGITKSALAKQDKPDVFPFIPIKSTYSDPTGSSVTAIGYPAETARDSIRTGVPLKTAATRIRGVYTLDGSTIDILETDPNPVAERGSSGGAIINTDHNLVGLIVAVKNDTTSSTVIEAISTPYIVRKLQGDNIDIDTIATTIPSSINSFASQINTFRALVLGN